MFEANDEGKGKDDAKAVAYAQVFHRFGKIYRAYMTAFETQVGVPMPRWRILETLSQLKGPHPQKTLVSALGMDPGALTRQVQQLESVGWIIRKVDERDNRLTNVEITEAGRDALEGRIGGRDQFLNDLIVELSDEQLPVVTGFLKDLELRIGEAKGAHSEAGVAATSLAAKEAEKPLAASADTL